MSQVYPELENDALRIRIVCPMLEEFPHLRENVAKWLFSEYKEEMEEWRQA